MRTSRVVFTAALLLAIAGPAIGALGAQDRTRAQAPPPPPAPSKPADQPTPLAVPPPPLPPVGNRNVQVDVTVKLDGAGAPISKHMTLVGVDGLVSLGRSGIDVPIANGTPMPSYRSVGMNVDARPRILDGNRIQLMLKLKFSAVLKAEASSQGPGLPAFSSSESELNLVLESGKPLVTSQSSDAEVGRGYSVEVKATILK